jgi:hypothetical protein
MVLSALATTYQLGLSFQAGVGDSRGEHLSGGGHLRMCHKLGLCGRQVSGKILGEVGGIKEEEAIQGPNQRLAAVGELPAVAGSVSSLSGACAAM